MAKYCGVDFGTSNSVISVIGDDDEPPVTIREPSILYFPEAKETTVDRFCGNAAVERYVAGGMHGRFFQSVKTLLPDRGFAGTSINGKKFSAEDLVAVMLRFLRVSMEEKSGIALRRAVFGRPARFSDKPQQDELAQERLRKAAEQAGFESVELEFEPVAGAHAFGIRNRRPATVFVADHGGGTSDFTVMRIMFEPGSLLPSRKEILATHGVRVGGDDFDADIMWRKLVRYFGYGSEYESWGKLLPIPVHIFRTLCRWDRIHLLKTISYREELRYFRNGATDPEAIDRLISLIDDDIGYFLFQSIEKAKVELSDVDVAWIDFERERIAIHEMVTVEEFAHAIRRRLEQLDEAISHTLKQASITAGDVSHVFLTGGSSRVHSVRDRLVEHFGAERVMDDVDQFNSVGNGLAVAARERGMATA